MSVTDEIDLILAETPEADDALRAVVSRLASLPGVTWAGIAFLEEDALVLGPAAGVEAPERRRCARVTFNGDPVGELWVDGDADAELLAHVAEAVSTHVLVGWDTGGHAWEP